MKKSIRIFLDAVVVVCFIMAFTACSSGQSQKSGDTQTSDDAKNECIIVADGSNASQPYAEFVDFGDGVLTINGGHMLNLEFKPQIKKAANTSYNNDEVEVILLDGSGKKLYKLHPFGKSSDFEEAFFSGDELYKAKFTFIGSTDTDEEAQEIVGKAKSFTLVMPLADRPVNKYADWDPVGNYEMTDAEGNPFTLVVKKGGSAELINQSLAKRSAEYEPSNGSWSKNSDEGFLKMSFFEGPFITIADHYAVTSPVLTPEYFYYDENSYRDDSDCIAVKKVK